MKKEIILAGFGGQGVMSMGKNLMEAAVEEDMQATWVPSYGPEMRGGTANCSVIISDTRIGTPLIEHPTELIAMNLPSLLKFESEVLPGGSIFINSSIISEQVSREDVTAYYVPCDDMASSLGNAKVANMIMLGAYVGATRALRPETIEAMIAHIFTGRKASLVPLNIEAFREGMNAVS